MADMLSQDEIDALLDVAGDEENEEELDSDSENTLTSQQQVTLYDLKDQIEFQKNSFVHFVVFMIKWQEV